MPTQVSSSLFRCDMNLVYPAPRTSAVIANVILWGVARYEKLLEKLKRLPPTMPFDDVQRILEAHGYSLVRSGAHNIFRDEVGQILNIPTVSGREVKRKYLRDVVEVLELED